MLTIGITMRYDIKENYEFIRSEYLDYIKPYFKPILLPKDNFEKLLPICDCFLVVGGDDVNPVFYHDTTDLNSTYVVKEVDMLDKSVIEYAMENNKPLMGICRGLQILNVVCGGNLIQHISNNSHKNIKDGAYLNLNKVDHPLVALLKNDFMINSYHHQAINNLGKGLINLGVSDGIIELIHHEKYPIFAMQWHPEKLNTKESKILIEYLFNLTKERNKQ